MNPDADPGWRPAISGALRGLVPGWGMRSRRRQPATADGLLILRGLYLSFVCAIGLIGVVVAILEGEEGIRGSVAERPAALVVLAVGVASLLAPRLLARPLSCESETALAGAYRQRFFLRIAFAEAAALVGFTGFIASGAGWIYLLGASFTAVGFARLAPTVRHLDQDRDDLRRRGCSLSLTVALRQMPRGR